MIRAGVVGATGYAGGELLRLLLSHPEVEVCAVSSRERAGTPVSELFANLRGYLDLCFIEPDAVLAESLDVLFYATPHGVAMHSAQAALDKGVRVIDLSADFRLKDLASWESWYGVKHAAPELIAEAVYGLAEVNRDAIKSARLVAVPGCYPTAIQLGLLPLLEQGVVDGSRLIADAKSGVSGAGRKAVEDYLLCETSESMRAYGVGGHRHHPEIVQGLNIAAGSEVSLTFVPHLAPMVRGILATLYAPLRADYAPLKADYAPLRADYAPLRADYAPPEVVNAPPEEVNASPEAVDASLKTGSQITGQQLQDIFEARYATEAFVDVLPAGRLPATRDVTGSNRCTLAVTLVEQSQMVVVVAAEDNLIKGAAGQAIQCMNLMFGWDESQGLAAIAPSP